MAPVRRPIRSFAMHGRVDGALLDYSEFFRWVGGLDRASTRLAVTDDLVLALESVREVGDQWQFRFISGDPTEVPLFYIEATGQTEERQPERGVWRGVPTRVSTNPSRRIMAVELRRAGVGATNLERFFSQLAIQQGFASRFSLDLNPLPSASFAVELERFGRIREAELVVRRPNTDWDDANDILSDLADESAGHQAAIRVNAGRGESLSKSAGVIALIKQHLQRPLSNVSNARVTGDDETGAERTVSLSRHQLQKRAIFSQGSTVAEQDEAIFQAAEELIAESGTVEDATVEAPAVETDT